MICANAIRCASSSSTSAAATQAPRACTASPSSCTATATCRSRWPACSSASGSSPETRRPHAELRDPRRNWYAKPGHKYFLYQYELHLLGGAAPLYGFEHFTRGEFRASTTEHVLPQTPTSKCWQVFSAENRALYTNCLGNLVLTNDNSVYFNYCFTRKRDGITDPDGKTTPCYRTSVLKQEQELADLRGVDARTGPAAPGHPRAMGDAALGTRSRTSR